MKVIGINYNVDHPAPFVDLQAGIEYEQIQVDNFFFEKGDIDSIYYEDGARTIFGRMCNRQACFQTFKAIRFELYSESTSLEKFYLYR